MIKFSVIWIRNRYDSRLFVRFWQASTAKVHHIEVDSIRRRSMEQSSANRSRGMSLSKQLLSNYFQRLKNLSNESSLEPVSTSVRKFLLPYMRHVQSIDNTAYCLNSLFETHEPLLANSTLSSKFKNIVQTWKRDLTELTDDLINHLTTNNSTSPTERITEKLAIPDETREKLDRTSNNSSSNGKRKNVNTETFQKRIKILEPDSEMNSSTSSSDQSKNLRFNEQGQLIVFVDGSCFSNGKSIAKAGYGVWFNYNHPLNISAPVHGVATNNNAEIQAATQAILKASSLGIKKIKLHTDSQFLINCMTQWIHKWKRNNWMTASKQPVKNKESLTELDSVLPLMEEVEWEYVEGHAGIAGNEEADVLAKNGASMYKHPD